MSAMKNLLVASVLVLGAAGAARAADPEPPEPARMERPTEAGPVARQLASSLGLQLRGAIQLEGTFRSDGWWDRWYEFVDARRADPDAGISPALPEVRGLRLELDGATIELLSFRTAADAVGYAQDVWADEDFAVEVRGAAAVVVRGPSLDPALARAVLAGAWPDKAARLPRGYLGVKKRYGTATRPAPGSDDALILEAAFAEGQEVLGDLPAGQPWIGRIARYQWEDDAHTHLLKVSDTGDAWRYLRDGAGPLVVRGLVLGEADGALAFLRSLEAPLPPGPSPARPTGSGLTQAVQHTTTGEAP